MNKAMKDAFYFSHDCNARNDPKVLALRSVYGMEGYGRYWVLIEMMREESNYKLMLTKYIWNAVAMQLQCSASEAEQFVSDCIKEFKLFESDGEAFWSNSLLRRMSGLEDKKEKARKAAKARWDKEREASNDADSCHTDADADAGAMQTQCDSNAIKLNKIRLNNNKLNKSKSNKNLSTREKVPVDKPVDNSDGEKQSSPLDQTNPEFITFWNAYPTHTGIKMAIDSWNELVAKGIPPADLIQAAQKYAAKVRRERTDPSFIKSPHNFLGDRTFKDYAPKFSSDCPKCHGTGCIPDDPNDSGGSMHQCDCGKRLDIA